MEEITQVELAALPEGEIFVIYIYSEACKFCKTFGPQVEKIASLASDIKFYKMNVMNNIEYFEATKAGLLPFLAIQHGPKFAGGEVGASEEGVLKIIHAIRELRSFMCRPSEPKSN